MPRAHQRSVPLPDPESLAQASLHYLSRFAASEESLRRVLLTKLRRAAMAHPDFAADHDRQAALRLQIEGIIARHKLSGALNDRAFAETKVASLRRAGRSHRAIRQKLAQKGLSGALISQTLEEHAQDSASESADAPADAQAEWQAALAFARKRRLGPFRPSRPNEGEADDQGQDRGTEGALRAKARAMRAAASFVRAGYSPALARKVLGLCLEDMDCLISSDS